MIRHFSFTPCTLNHLKNFVIRHLFRDSFIHKCIQIPTRRIPTCSVFCTKTINQCYCPSSTRRSTHFSFTSPLSSPIGGQWAPHFFHSFTISALEKVQHHNHHCYTSSCPSILCVPLSSHFVLLRSCLSSSFGPFDSPFVRGLAHRHDSIHAPFVFPLNTFFVRNLAHRHDSIHAPFVFPFNTFFVRTDTIPLCLPRVYSFSLPDLSYTPVVLP